MSRVNEIAIKILAGLFIWFCVNTLVFAFPTFDGGMYILDDNYLIGGWPGKIWECYTYAGGLSRVTQIENKVDKFAVTNNYILLEAGNEWYAINRQDNEISEFVSLEALKNTLKLEDNIRFTTSRPWLRLHFFWPAFFVSLIAGVFIFGLFFSGEIKRFIFPRKLTDNKAENEF